MPTQSALEAYLHRHDDNDWARTASLLRAETHEVDQAATRIWLAFYPIALARVLAAPHDPARLERELLLQGRYRLADQMDTSHAFLYGHRYWPEVKRAILDHAQRPAGRLPGPLAGVVRDVARAAATACDVDRTLVTAIAAVGLSTLQQVGLHAFRASPGEVHLAEAERARTPEQVLARRARNDSQGLFGFLRGERKLWTVTFDERDPEGHFPLVHTQALTTAAASDPRDWRGRDPRLVEGPIPVQCRSASCGTCWVGVLGGPEKLSAVEALERRKLAEFGYSRSADPQPRIRLACQARATGAVSIVIPPWNGVIGKLVLPAPDAPDRAGAD